jgi:hypothetical protein
MAMTGPKTRVDFRELTQVHWPEFQTARHWERNSLGPPELQVRLALQADPVP